MKRILTMLVVAVVAAGLTGCGGMRRNMPEERTEKKTAVSTKTAEAMPSKEEMMAKWQEYSTPDEHHKVLNALVGQWDHTTEWWMDPSQPPERSKGKSDIKWVMGGRFLEHSVSGKSMGQPFTGKGIMGFDKANNEYRTVWYDSMGTGLMIGTGSYDPKSNMLVETGTASCPLKGTVKYRSVMKLLDKGHFRYEMYMEPPGQNEEMKVMQINYTKRAKG